MEKDNIIQKSQNSESQADLTTVINQGRKMVFSICLAAVVIISLIGIYFGDRLTQRALFALLFLMPASECFVRFWFYKTKFYLLGFAASLVLAAICFIDYIMICIKTM